MKPNNGKKHTGIIRIFRCRNSSSAASVVGPFAASATICKSYVQQTPYKIIRTLPGWLFDTHTHTHTQSGFTGARDNEWQWHQLDHMQICPLTQTYNHTGIPPLSFLQAGCPSCRPTNSVKALKANWLFYTLSKKSEVIQ